MKKQSIALILALSATLAACGNSNQNKDTDKAATNQKQEEVNTENSDNKQDNDIEKEDSNIDNEDKDTENNESKQVVYTSFYPIYNLTKQIAGDKMDVKAFTNLKTESHGWEPSAKDMADLSDSNIMFINGAGMEEWEESVEDSSDVDLINTSENIDLIKASDEDHDHEHEDADDDHDESEHVDADQEHEDAGHDHEESEEHHHHHGMYDPHIWLSPVNGKEQAKVIADKLSEIDPDNKDYYMDNYKKIEKELDDMIDEYKEKFDGVDNKDFMVTHKAFSYLARDFGLNQMALTGLMSTGEVNPDVLKDAVNDAKNSNINTIFYEMGGSDKQAKILADEIKGDVAPLNTMEYATDEDLDKDISYQDLVKDNLEALYKSMSK
jgi:periplasmic solute binding protein